MNRCGTCAYWIGDRDFPDGWDFITKGRCRWNPEYIKKTADDFCHNHQYFDKKEEDARRL